MVTIVPPDEDWSKAFRQLGEGMGEGYQNRSDEVALQNAITSLGENATPRQILDAITKTKTYSPESKQNLFKNYLGAAEFEEAQKSALRKEDIEKARNTIMQGRNIITEKKEEKKERKEYLKDENERRKANAIIDQLNLPTEQKESLKNNISIDSAEDLLKDQLKQKKSKLTPFEKTVQQKNAEEYINLTKRLPELQSNLENINYSRELADQIGPFKMIGGAMGLSGKAKELEGISFTLIEPIVKIFNPSGPLAQQKLKMIKDKYVIKATDFPQIRRAKLDALERFGKQAYDRTKKKLELIQKYGGNPSTEAIENFDKESDTLADAMLDFDIQGEEVKDERLPSAGSFKGKTITSPEGQKFYSDGTRWLKK